MEPTILGFYGALQGYRGFDKGYMGRMEKKMEIYDNELVI